MSQRLSQDRAYFHRARERKLKDHRLARCKLGEAHVNAGRMQQRIIYNQKGTQSHDPAHISQHKFSILCFFPTSNVLPLFWIFINEYRIYIISPPPLSYISLIPRLPLKFKFMPSSSLIISLSPPTHFLACSFSAVMTTPFKKGREGKEKELPSH